MSLSALKVLVVDNYDSFTFNLVHYLESLVNAPVTVWRNDAFTPEHALDFDCIVISPGPGLPEESGCCLELIKQLSGKRPILGVCMGMQCIAVQDGAQLENLRIVQHGKATPIEVLDHSCLFQNLPLTPLVGRYHSWVVKPDTLSARFKVLAHDLQGTPMAIRQVDAPTWGVQFHPESLLTPEGKLLLGNFLMQVVAHKKQAFRLQV